MDLKTFILESWKKFEEITKKPNVVITKESDIKCHLFSLFYNEINEKKLPFMLLTEQKFKDPDIQQNGRNLPKFDIIIADTKKEETAIIQLKGNAHGKKKTEEEKNSKEGENEKCFKDLIRKIKKDIGIIKNKYSHIPNAKFGFCLAVDRHNTPASGYEEIPELKVPNNVGIEIITSIIDCCNANLCENCEDNIDCELKDISAYKNLKWYFENTFK